VPIQRAFVCCFKPHALARFAPSTCAGVATTVPYGTQLVAIARRGPWLRVQLRGVAAELERWMLTSHPFHGALLMPIDGGSVEGAFEKAFAPDSAPPAEVQ
jgi:hypothetical protein